MARNRTGRAVPGTAALVGLAVLLLASVTTCEAQAGAAELVTNTSCSGVSR